MSELITIARPYAKAAFDFACQQDEIKHWQKMLSFAAEISDHHTIANLLRENIAYDVLADLFISLCGKRLNEFGKNFIRIMAENKRLSLLSEVLQLFQQYCAERDSITDVEVISVVKLTKSQENKIAKAMEKCLSQKINLTNKIDKSIISGLIIRGRDMVIDQSIRGRLERLTDALQS